MTPILYVSLQIDWVPVSTDLRIIFRSGAEMNLLGDICISSSLWIFQNFNKKVIAHYIIYTLKEIMGQGIFESKIKNKIYISIKDEDFLNKENDGQNCSTIAHKFFF